MNENYRLALRHEERADALKKMAVQAVKGGNRDEYLRLLCLMNISLKIADRYHDAVEQSKKGE